MIDTYMKKIFAFMLLAAVSCWSATGLRAETKEVQEVNETQAGTTFTVDHVVYEITGTFVTVQGCDGFTGDGYLTIPAKVTYNNKTYYVLAIRTSAFYGNTQLKHLTIQLDPSADLVTINQWAFRDCTNLTDVTFQNEANTLDIRGDVFNGCTKLTYITFPNRTMLSAYVFAKSGVKQITFNGSVEYLSTATFGGATVIEKLVFKNTDFSNISVIQGYDGTDDKTLAEAFSPLKNTLKSLSVTNTNLPANLCYGFTALETVDFLYTVQARKIGDYAFYNCTNLKTLNFGTIGAPVASIGNSAFAYTAINHTLYLNGVQTIGELAFAASTVPGVQLGADKSEQTIGSAAFINCKSLKTVNIYGQVKTLAANAFTGCTAVTTLRVSPSNKWMQDYTEDHGPFQDMDQVTDLLIPASSAGKVGNYLFSGMTGLKNITWRNQETSSIGTGAFYGCSSLATVTLPTGCKSLSDYAFADCKALKTLYVPKEVPSFTNPSTVFRNDPLQTIYGSCTNVETLQASKTWLDICSNIQAMTPNFTVPEIRQTSRGTVYVRQEADCSGEMIIEAVANAGWHFDHWSDSTDDNPRTENPRTINLRTEYLDYIAAIFEQGEGIDDVQRDDVQSTKVLRDGQILIIRDGKAYNMLGAEMK